MEFRDLPSVDQLSGTLSGYPPKVRVRAAREAIAEARETLARGGEVRDLHEAAKANAEALERPSFGPVLNASGVVLHTGLGRSRLAPSVARHVANVASSYSDLEFDLETGERGDRQDHVRDLLRELTGAEDAFVVNNAAAGVMLTLSALCAGQEVALSRGEMVEIGGAFRMPDIVRQSGCRLIEVGCTNRTYLRDYEEALHQGGSILRCHPSNFRIEGFTCSPDPADLRALADAREGWFIDDQGSGLLTDSRSLGLSLLPTLPDAARHAHVAIASGDKLMGGPQSGVVVGKKEAIREIRRHPLARAFRIDKLSLAALEATLRLWASGEEDQIPAIRYLRRPLDEVRATAERIGSAWGGGATAEPGITEAGSGSAPGSGVPTWRVGIEVSSPIDLAKKLRQGSPAIISYVANGRVWLDPRTLEDDEVGIVAARLRELRS